MKKENKIKPISPKEVTHMIPDFIFEAVNKLINEKWNGESATILQDEIMEIVSSDDEDNEKPSRQTVFNNHWLDIEEHYRNVGWKVTYDKPAYCENYKAFFRFELP